MTVGSIGSMPARVSACHRAPSTRFGPSRARSRFRCGRPCPRWPDAPMRSRCFRSRSGIATGCSERYSRWAWDDSPAFAGVAAASPRTWALRPDWTALVGADPPSAAWPRAGATGGDRLNRRPASDRSLGEWAAWAACSPSTLRRGFLAPDRVHVRAVATADQAGVGDGAFDRRVAGGPGLRRGRLHLALGLLGRLPRDVRPHAAGPDAQAAAAAGIRCHPVL